MTFAKALVWSFGVSWGLDGVLGALGFSERFRAAVRLGVGNYAVRVYLDRHPT